ncbi:MAG: protein kinase [Gemmatimonadota bacterium]|nr:MAG: protein kinase [Gemmatimonadota bacterium]
MPDPFAQFREEIADKYAVEREIGRGGMAIVYLAQDLKHDRQVAVKVLLPELSTSLGTQRFLREVKIAAGLQHPHILPIYDSGEAAGLLYYVMPYVEGHTLRDRLDRETQLPIDESLQIVRDVANALSYAHKRGIVHRDIKPENILISEGYPVVADFGIARALTEAGGDKLTQTGVAIGTPAYMSPEQVREGAQVDGRSDLYSLGCVLYEMLAGQPPFTGATPQVIMARHALDPVPPLRTVRGTVPESVERAVAQSLAKVPADRFTSGEQMIQAMATQPGIIGPDLATPPTGASAASFFSELRRRRVYHTAVVYVVIGLGILEAASITFPQLGLPPWMMTLVVLVALLGFPVTLVISWMYDLTSKGFRRTSPWGVTVSPPGTIGTGFPSPPGTGVVSPPPSTLEHIPAGTTAPITPDLGRVEEVSATLPYGGPPAPLAGPVVKEPSALLTSKVGLTSLLALAFFVNWLETTLETRLGGDSAFITEIRHQTAHAVHWLEANLSFEYHDVTNSIATIGYSSSYFILFPLLLIAVGIALARRPQIRPFRVFSLAVFINYALCLPFFILFPIPERWAYSESGAMLLSDKWSSQLIEAFRPISGLDNCFPSFHVSLTVVIVLVAMLYGMRLRWSVLALGGTIVLSTFVLGIHWIADIIAGLAVGALSVMLALRIDHRIPEDVWQFMDIALEDTGQTPER